MVKIKRSICLFLFTTLFTQIFAVVVNVQGCIKDKISKEPLIGATVQVIGMNIGAVTDMDGNFKLTDIKNGTYDLKIQYVGYKTAITKQVKIVKNQIVTLDLEMDLDEKTLGDVVVVAKANRESENVALIEQRRNVLAVQAVTSKELSRKGVGDAKDAVTKVSGISKQDGIKNVFVRGLGDRYNYTTLNGLPLTSEDPEYKNIALDFFTTDFIQTVGINKTFDTNKSGDVTGAVIDISSKELYNKKEFSVDISGGINAQTLGKDFYKSSGTNFFGFSDNKMPSENGDFNFKNSISPSKHSSLFNKSISIKGGKKYNINQNTLSLFAVGAYDNNYEYTNKTINEFLTNNDQIKKQTGKESNISTNHLGMLNAEYKIQEKHYLKYNLIYIHANNQSVTSLSGKDSDLSNNGAGDNCIGGTLYQQTKDNTLLVNQLLTKWSITPRITLNINGSYNRVDGNEPDRRINTIMQDDSQAYYFALGDNVQQRYYSNLNKNDYNAQALLKYNISNNTENKSFISLGYRSRHTNDDFKSKNFIITPTSDIMSQAVDENTIFNNLDQYFNSSNLNKTFLLKPGKDEYNIKSYINSGMVDFMYYVSPKFVVNAGVRVDDVNMKLNWLLYNGTTYGDKEIKKQFVLPSLNIKYDFNKKNAIRIALSKTYTLPQAKEWSPFKYLDIDFSSEGNENLKPSDNYNFDIKWDYFMTPSELISFGVFYKYIVDPISRVNMNNAAGTLTYDNTSDKATVMGGEIELRKNIFNYKNSNTTKRLSSGLNAAYTHTYIKSNLNQAIDDVTGTKLEGAAPFILNYDLSYNYSKRNNSFINTIVLNYFSDRVYSTGLGGYYDIIEKGIPTLDFISQANLNKHISLSFKAKNIINPSSKLTQEVKNGNKKIRNTINEYKKGIDLSLSVAYKF